MDAERFDHLVRAFASRPSRRSLLKAALGLGGAAAAAALGALETAACAPLGAACSSTNPCCNGRCSGSVCVCPGNTTACNGACVRTQRDENNCGACGNVCPEGRVCRDGVCACPGQTVLCNGVCVNPRNDESNCGGCGVTCVASSPCTEAVCRQGVCRESRRPNGTPCDDGDACIRSGVCRRGVCVPDIAVSCSPGPCQQSGTCNPETGACEYVDLPDGSSCEDNGDPCTLDVCEAGACTHPPRDCDDGDPCTVDTCDPETGACLHESIDCDDGDACTVDSCVDGQCIHEPLDCEGEDPCVTFGCDPEFGCTQEPLDCADEDLCTTDSCDPDTGTCKHDPIECGDGPPCSSGSCDPDIGCVYTPKECPAGESLDTTDCTCKPRCTEAQTECGGSCVDLDSDDNNCGGCGNVCEPGPDGCVTTCVNGRCDWIPMNCAPSDTPPGVNVAACCVGKSCCTGTQTACCLNPGHICWSEGNLGGIVHCSPP